MSFRELGVPNFGVLIIRILLFRVLYSGPLFSETPKCESVRRVFQDRESQVPPRGSEAGS